MSHEGWLHAFHRVQDKLATSPDGLEWKQNGTVCLDFKDENETALARPCIVKEYGIYRMWLSYKTKSQNYRLGYTEFGH